MALNEINDAFAEYIFSVHDFIFCPPTFFKYISKTESEEKNELPYNYKNVKNIR